MKVKVRFLRYSDYWVAEAENGAVSQGATLDECRENVRDAITLLNDDDGGSAGDSIIEEIEEVLEVST